jgi:protein TonB
MNKCLLIAVLLLAALSGTAQRKRRSGYVTAAPVPVVFRQVSQAPDFPGDLAAWMGSHLRYPDDARESGVEGNVHVLFEIGLDGKAKVIAIAKSSGMQSLDQEARRVISGMPPWRPARLNGRLVPYRMMLPVRFRLD